MADRNLPPRPPPSSSTPRTGAPVWSITRHERTEMTPPGHSRSSSQERAPEDAQGIYRARTVTSTERVQIVQMPMELSEVSAEQLRLLSLSPQTEASREVCTTTTTIEAGAVPIVSGVSADGVPLISGISMNQESRQTTTIITTTTTTYKIIEDEGSSDGFDLVDLERTEQRPLRMDTSKDGDDFVMVKEGTESSITSTSEDEGPLSSLTSADERDEFGEGKKKPFQIPPSDVATTSIVVIPAAIRSPPYSPHSFANTSTFSSRSSDGNASEFVQFDEAELNEHLAAAIATRRMREMAEEPLGNWVTLPDGRREMSTQTMDSKKPSIRWSPEMEIASTSRSAEVRSIQIDQYVDVYSSGYSDEPTKEEESKTIDGRKGQSMFETWRRNEMEIADLDELVTRYHPGFQEEDLEKHQIRPIGSMEIVTHLSKKIAQEDYPISDPYLGPLEEMERRKEFEEESMERRVNVYSNGQSDVEMMRPKIIPPDIDHYDASEEQQFSISTMISTIITNAQEEPDFPSTSAQFHENVPETMRRGEIEERPLDYHVTAYHPGRSDLEIPIAPTTIITTTKVKKTIEDYPSALIYEGPVDSTNLRAELDTIPIDQHVEAYHTGYYDQLPLIVPIKREEKESTPSETSKKHGAFEKITHLFKRTTTHEEAYPPITDPYVGPLAETNPQNQLHRNPIDQFASVYSSGRSDEPRIEPVLPTTVPVQYPQTMPFEGPLSSTIRRGELDGSPLDSHVNVYHSGRSDEHVSVPAPIQPKPIVEAEPELLPAYPQTTFYEGPLASTSKHGELEETALDSHVSAYHPGRSDIPAEEPTAPHETITTKITSIFKKTTHEADFPPISTPFLGPIDETRRIGEMEKLPLEHHVTAYNVGHYDQLITEPSAKPQPHEEEEKKGGTLEKLTHLFRRSKTIEDFPAITEAYTGPLAHTGRGNEAPTEPIHSYVTVYSSGRSDEIQPVKMTTVKIVSTPEYPAEEALFTGHVPETMRRGEMEERPLDSHVTAYHPGRSDLEIPIAPTTIITTTKVKKTVEDYPSAIIYEGPVDSTNRRTELDTIPIGQHVEAYHTGYYDQLPPVVPIKREEKEPTPSETSKKHGAFEKITHLFKRTTTHEEAYPPITDPYVGPLAETNPQNQLHRNPIDQFASVYSSGRSDEPRIEPVLPTTVPVQYPQTMPFEGPLSSTIRRGELDGSPLDSHVNVYHSGRSDEHVSVPAPIQPKPIVEAEPELLPAYPQTTFYEGPLASTSKHGELEETALDSHVSAYHPGRSDIPAKEPTAPHETITTKITSIFKKTTHEADFPPISTPFLGPIDETRRIGEMEKLPLEHHVTAYNVGHYDQLITEPSAKPQPHEEEEKKGGTLEKLTHLFRRSKTIEDFPAITEAYTGPLAHTGRGNEAPTEPIHSYVTVYSSGRSDEIQPVKMTTVKIVSTPEYPAEEALFTGHVPETMRRGEMEERPLDSHVTAYHPGRSDLEIPVAPTTIITTTKVKKTVEDYPSALIYEGPVDSTNLRAELDTIPIDQHVEAYHTGYYDQLPPIVPIKREEKEPTPSETSKKHGAFEKITHLFKRTTTHEEAYPPITEPYAGPLAETNPQNQLHRNPIDQFVSIYSSGRSDEQRIEPVLPTMSPAQYPKTMPYEGPLSHTIRRGELDGSPLDSHVNVYHSGRSDEHVSAPAPIQPTTIVETEAEFLPAYPQTTIYEGPLASTSRHGELEGTALDSHVSAYHPGRSDIPVEEPAAPHETITMKITSIFKKTTTHEADFPPISTPFLGAIDETRRIGEMEKLPLEHHVTAYNVGHYDQLVTEPSAKPQPHEEEEKKGGTLEKLTHLFRRSKTIEDFPAITEPYTGPLAHTGRGNEAPTEPIHSFVTVYSSGRSDEIQPAKMTTVKIVGMPEFPAEEAPFTGYVPETMRRGEMEERPLDSHVTAYHPGRSDLEIPVAPTTIITTTKVKKTIEDYPSALIYEGPVDSTNLRAELDTIPIDQHVEAYHTGYYDQLPPVVPIKREEKEPTPSETSKKHGAIEKITHLFKRTTTHEEAYPPITDPYVGPLAETNPQYELLRNPIDQFVSVYSSGRSDEPRIEPVLPTTVPAQYPQTMPYEGPLSSTIRRGELDGSPLDSHVNVYHSGRSDEYVSAPAQIQPTTIVETEPELLPAYPQTTVYEGPLASTSRHGELEGTALDSHVSAYHPGRSDIPAEEPTAPHETITTKITSIFKKTTHEADFPSISTPFLGPIDETRRIGEIEKSPLEHHVTAYNIGHYDQLATEPPAKPSPHEEEEKKGGALEKLTHLFRRSKTIEDFPTITEPYTGPLAHTGRRNEAPTEPIHSFVTVYSSGRSDEMQPAKMTTIKIVGMLEYPVEEAPLTGYVPETMRRGEMEEMPLDSHVTAYHPGRSDLEIPVAPTTIITTTKVKKTVEDYPSALIYEGPVDSTNLRAELDTIPIDQHVEAYHTGYYDQLPLIVPIKREEKESTPSETSKKHGAFEKITHLFKRTTTHEEAYPPMTDPYVGPLAETNPQYELLRNPIDQFVSVYSSGRSDEPRIEPVLLTTVPAQYPQTMPYEGPLSSTIRRGELDGSPLDSHVNVYHSGRSDENVSAPAPIQPKTIVETEPELLPAYPQTTVYEGPLASTSRHGELEGIALDSHVSAYHPGRSDIPAEEPAAPHETITTKITSIFKKTTAHETDFPPISTPFLGPIDETRRIGEMEKLPLEHHVTAYNVGHYDQLVTEPPAKPQPHEEEEKKGGTLEKLTHLFRRSKIIEDFPAITEAYTGPLAHTGQGNEAPIEPIHSYVTVYSSGRSDEIQPAKMTTVKIVGMPDYPAEEAPFTGHVPATMRRGEMEERPLDSHVTTYHPGRSDLEIPVAPTTIITTTKVKKTVEDYPSAIIYEGPVDSTNRRTELDTIPIGQHVEAYHTGYYDQLPPIVPIKREEKEPTPSETSKKHGAFEKITHLFKRTTTHEEAYPPITEPYAGPLAETNPQNQLHRNPIDQFVSIYSSGRSDEPRNEPVLPTMAPEQYPKTMPYEGPLSHTIRRGELDGSPLDSHVNVYHSGRSDEHVSAPAPIQPTTIVETEPEFLPAYPQTTVYEGPLTSTSRHGELEGTALDSQVSAYHPGRSDIPAEESAAPHETITTKITSIFKKTPHEADFPPISTPFLGPIDETRRIGEMEKLPLEHHVTAYNIGHYDQLVTEPTIKPTPHEEEEKKGGALEKLTHLFKRSKTIEDFTAITEAYTGPLAYIGRGNEAPTESIHSFVTVYSSGRSDEIQPAKMTTIKIVVMPEYPVEEAPFTGYVPETIRRGEIEERPLDSHVTAYHPGRSDLEIPFAPTTIITTTKAKKTIEDYPSAIIYEGPVDSTNQIAEIDTVPIGQHVEAYHTGYYDQLPPVVPIKQEEKEPTPSETSKKHGAFEKITHLFKRTTTHEEAYPPITEPYARPLAETNPQNQLHRNPIDQFVSIYSSGRSDEPRIEPVLPTMAPAQYPKTMPYEGPLSHTIRRGELNGRPLDSHVNVYHSGRSDEHVSAPASIQPTTIVETEPEFLPAYPQTTVYEGPLASTSRHGELVGTALDSQVSAYHPGRSDIPAEESAAPHETITTKITSIFKKTPLEADFPPISTPFLGPIDETRRIGEMEKLPLEHHVTAYNIGHYDQLVTEPSAKPQPHEEEEKKGRALEKLTHLFRRSKTIEDFPAITEPYTGPLAHTGRGNEAPTEPIHSFVIVYSSGRSDEIQPAKMTTVKIVGMPDYPAEEAPFTGYVPETMRRGELEERPLDSHVTAYHPGRSDLDIPVAPTTIITTTKVKKTIEDYPSAIIYEGPVDSTNLRAELDTIPIDQHVEAYHTGYYDQLPPIVPIKREEKEPTPSETSKKHGAFEKITLLFKRTTTRGEAYPPITEPYAGPLAETNPQYELLRNPIDQFVSVYSSGRSDEPRIETVLPTTSQAQYPQTMPYEGPLSSTIRRGELDGSPLDSHVNVYHSGRSDEHVSAPAPIQPTTIVETEPEFLPAYPQTTVYEGPLASISRHGELEGTALDSHVSAYHPGRSDIPTEEPAMPHEKITTKIPSIFKKTTHEADFPPISNPFLGPIDETRRIGEMEKLPLEYHVTAYNVGHYDQLVTEPPAKPQPHEEEEKKGRALEKLTHLFRRSKTIEDFPAITEPYTGPLAHTGRGNEAPTEPIHSFVIVYSSGRSDEIQPTKMTTVKIVGMPDYPAEEAPFTGYVPETMRRGEMEERPLDSHVIAYHPGRSDLDIPIAPTTIITTTKVKKTVEDYPSALIYEGPVDSTNRIAELDTIPIGQHVEAYHTGYYDQLPPVVPIKREEKEPTPSETSKKHGAIEKITHLFKRTTTHEEAYPPITDPYVGPLAETNSQYELHRNPIDQFVSVYSSGRSDEPRIETVLPTMAPAQYPKTMPFEGPLSSTIRRGELDGSPLDSHVNVYHSGRSDEHISAPAPIQPTPIVETEAEFLPAYPQTTIYEGPLASTSRHGELEGTALDSHVSAYHPGRSDIPVEEPAAPHETITTKITSIFKKTTHEADFPPISTPFLGPIDETIRIGEMEKLPLEHYVTAYNVGHYDQLVTEPPAKPQPHEEEEKKGGTLEKLTHLFRRSKTIEDFPAITEAYTGPLAHTGRGNEAPTEPIHSYVTVYSSGRSDEIQPAKMTTVKIVGMPEYPAEEAPFTGHVPETMRRGEMEEMPLDSHVTAYHPGRSDLEIPIAPTTIITTTKVKKTVEDYPSAIIYEGPVDSTNRRTELDTIPIGQHVEAYHTGYYDQLPPIVPIKREEKEPTPSETSKKHGAFEKITLLFKRTTTHEEAYPPITEPYAGPLAETNPQNQLHRNPIDQFVSIYSSGRSDEQRIEPVLPTMSPAQYPKTMPYEGPLSHTIRRGELDGSPLDSHVNVYHSGRSDEHVSAPAPIQPTKIVETEAEFLPAYPQTTIYEGPLASTSRHGELEGTALDSHVSAYHPGRSDIPVEEPAAPHETITTKITSIFKKTTHEADFPPISTPFLGPIDETRRIGEMEKLPLEHYVTAYNVGHYDQLVTEPPAKPQPHEEEEKKGGTLEKLTHLFRRSKTIEDFPAITEAYTGPLAHTGRGNEAPTEPIHSYVTVYSSGRSDEIQPAKMTTVKIVGMPEYPAEEAPFTGHVPETMRRAEMEERPLDSHVTAYHPGRSDLEIPIAPTTIITTTKVKKTVENYPSAIIYEGPVDSTNRRAELETIPIGQHVEAYHTGYYDQLPPVVPIKREEKEPTPSEISKKHGAFEKITHLFKRTTTHEEAYPPITEPYAGPLAETNPQSQLHRNPIDQFVSIYSSGRSDEPRIEPVLPTTVPAQYPQTMPYEGSLSSTIRRGELDGSPLDSHVNVYHSGKSDEHISAPASIQPTPIVETEPKFLPAYPQTTVYEGPLASISRHGELEGTALDSHVSAYHPGRSDIPTEEPAVPHETITTKITSIFKKTTHEADFPPISNPFLGQIDETKRIGEMEKSPLEHHVTAYNVGHYDQLVTEPPAKPQPHEEEEKKGGTLEKLTHLFRRSKTIEDFPAITEPYTGPLAYIGRGNEAPTEPIHSYVTVYSSGRSDEIQPAKMTTVKIVGMPEYPAEEAPFTGHVPETMRRAEMEERPLDSHVTAYHPGRSDLEIPIAPTTIITTTKVKKTVEDYPSAIIYEGPVDSTNRRTELDTIPIGQHVEAYHTGYYDQLPPIVPIKREEKEPSPSETSKKHGAFEKITHLFKRTTTTHEEAYPPITEPYAGPLAETNPQSQLHRNPIDQFVSIYSSGRSDEPRIEPVLPTTVPAQYPQTMPYEGSLSSTIRRGELDGSPLDSHVNVYHSGKSDEHISAPASIQPTPIVETEPKFLPAYPQTTVYEGPLASISRHGELEGTALDSHVSAYHPGRSDIPTEEPAVPHETITTKITSIFKKTTHEADFPPISNPFLGQIDETKRIGEMEKSPLEHHVTAYNVGHYDQLVTEPPAKPQPHEEEEKKGGTLEKLTHLFRRSKTIEDFPAITEPYTGPLAYIGRGNEAPTEPIHSYVTVYSSGRSDEIQPAKMTTVKIVGMPEYPAEEAPFTGHVPETMRRAEMEERPLDSHVTAYHPGRSDLEIPIAPTTIITTTKVKKTVEDYPSAIIYEGPVDSTNRRTELDTIPIGQHVEAYHTGYYDQLPPIVPIKREEKEPSPSETSKKHGAFEKITHLFKRTTTTHEEAYPPITEPYAGPLAETNPQNQLHRNPIDQFVNIYSSGRSDEPRIEPVLPTTVPAQYPQTMPYEGPLSHTIRRGELDGSPLDSHVNVYHSGRSDEHVSAPASIQPIKIVETEPEFLPAYPQTTNEGPLASTSRHDELEGTALDSHVSAYHPGRSDIPAEEPAAPHDTITTKITSIFKKTTHEADFPPIFTPFLGPIDETRRIGEMEKLPLEHLVTAYNIGHYDQLATAPPKIDIQQHLFKYLLRSPFEIRSITIDNFVDIYHSGHSDAIDDEEFIHGSIETIIPARKKSSPTISIFQPTHDLPFNPIDKIVTVYHCDFIHHPPTKILTGGDVLDQFEEKEFAKATTTSKNLELKHVPIEQIIQIYHHGWYGGKEAVESPGEKKRPPVDVTEIDGGILQIEQDRQIHGIISPADDVSIKPPSTLEPVELHVRINEKRYDSRRVPTEAERRAVEAKVQETKIMREAERFQPPQRETRRMVYESRREDIGIGIDAKPKPKTYYAQMHSPTFANQKERESSKYYNEKMVRSISTLPQIEPRKTIRSYTDQAYYYSPGSKRHPGWTTVTETTTITYAKRHSFDRTVNGRQQHVVEDIIVYNHGGRSRVPPGLPKSPAPRRTLPSQYLDERYHNISQRYNYYRSRSQDNAQPRKHDKWLQTDEDDLAAAAERSESRTSRSMNRTEIRTYRSYSSHLYDRHAYAREYSPAPKPETIPYREEQNKHWFRTDSIGADRQSRGTSRQDDAMMRRTVSPQSTTFPVVGTQATANGHAAYHEHTVTEYSSSLQRGTPKIVRKLHYQRANIEELPISQLLSEIPRLRDQSEENAAGMLHRNGGTAAGHRGSQNGGTMSAPRILPLETRILDPGVHHYHSQQSQSLDMDGNEQRNGTKVRRPPLRRARQSIRNYCAML